MDDSDEETYSVAPEEAARAVSFTECALRPYRLTPKTAALLKQARLLLRDKNYEGAAFKAMEARFKGLVYSGFDLSKEDFLEIKRLSDSSLCWLPCWLPPTKWEQGISFDPTSEEGAVEQLKRWKKGAVLKAAGRLHLRIADFAVQKIQGRAHLSFWAEPCRIGKKERVYASPWTDTLIDSEPRPFRDSAPSTSKDMPYACVIETREGLMTFHAKYLDFMTGTGYEDNKEQYWKEMKLLVLQLKRTVGNYWLTPGTAAMLHEGEQMVKKKTDRIGALHRLISVLFSGEAYNVRDLAGYEAKAVKSAAGDRHWVICWHAPRQIKEGEFVKAGAKVILRVKAAAEHRIGRHSCTSIWGEVWDSEKDKKLLTAPWINN